MQTTTPLVLNWHLTEACNYRCRYCYAIWETASCGRELIHDPRQAEALLTELYSFFDPSNRANPLMDRMSWDTVRLNLAGGEPLLHDRKLPALIRHARRLGFEVSLITNASLLTAEALADLTPDLTWLGVSIDSANPATNRDIGRIDRRGGLLDLDVLSNALQDARARNPLLRLKLNTVVSQLNYSEDLSLLIRRLAPDKWKVLRVLPVVNDELALPGEAFDAFVARHRQFAAILCAEDNQDMRESYLMVDPHGRFFQNGRQAGAQGYIYSRPILEVGAASAFAGVPFDADRFCARYPQPTAGICA